MEDINRKAILIYLRNLVILETIRNKSSNHMVRLMMLRKEIETAKVETCVPANHPTNVIGIYVEELGGLWWLALSVAACVVAGLVSLIFDEFILLVGGLCVLLHVILLTMALRSIEENKKENARSIVEAEQKNRLAVEQYNEQQRQLGEVITIIRQLNEEHREVTALLESEYATNLIPKQFRTIEGIYYLYEYMSTSTQSLRDALLHANLNEIKDRLNEIIQQHERTLQVLQKGIRNIVRQNTEVLQQAKAAARSAQDAAMYQQITADNSKLSLILQREQLAYQRAEFFLR